MKSDTGSLRIDGTETADNTIPADLLVRIVNGFQRVTLLVGASLEKKEVGQRFKPDANLRRRVALRLAVPVPGSFGLPFAVADERRQVEMPGGPSIVDATYDVCDAIRQRDSERLLALVPDFAIRTRVMAATRDILPRKGESWFIGFSAGDRTEMRLDAVMRETIEQWSLAPDDRSETMTVIGRLVRIDFDESKVVVEYPPTKRELECVYLPEVEEPLLNSRRDMIQVTGHFLLSDDGHPKRLVNVNRIEPVDLSPLRFDRVVVDGRAITFFPPLILNPCLDNDSQQVFTANQDDLHLFASGGTRDELVDDIVSQLTFLYREYLEADPEDLAHDAIRLRSRLESFMHVSTEVQA